MIRRYIDHLLRREKTNSSPPPEDNVVVSGGSEVTDNPNATMLTPRDTDAPDLPRNANDPVER